MNALSADTHSKMEALQIQIIRHMPAWEKLSIVDDLNETVRTLAICGIRQRHPAATPAEVHRMLAGLVLGEGLAHKVYDHAG